MSDDRRRQRFEADDYELLRLEKRQKRQYEAYLKKKRRERTVLIALFMFLFLIIVLGIAAYVNKQKIDGEVTTASQASAATTASAPSSKTAESSETAIVTLPPETTAPATESAPETTVPLTSLTEAPPTETETAVDPNAPQPLTDQGPETVYERTASIPSWVTKDLLHISGKNRPGTKLDAVKNVVIHWVGNANSSAKDNRDYFETLSNPNVNTEGIGASSHFIVGLRGEILQCVPIEEVAFANYPRNNDTVSIEVCHPDWEGKFSDVTYASVIKLAAWALEVYGLTADDLIRHYDVRGKECPKYYVQHPEAWEQLKADVRQYMSDHPDIANEFP